MEEEEIERRRADGFCVKIKARARLFFSVECTLLQRKCTHNAGGIIRRYPTELHEIEATRNPRRFQGKECSRDDCFLRQQQQQHGNSNGKRADEGES